MREDGKMVVGKHRNTKVIVDLGAIKENVAQEKQQLEANQKLFAVVKANAYGHGLVEVAQAASQAGADGFCVAVIDEGVALRQAGFEQEPILILGVNPASEATYMASYNLAVAVSSLDFLQAAQPELLKAKLKLRVHLALDTGMGRIGFKDVATLKAAVAYLNATPQAFVFEGIFTHFAQADSKDTSYYHQQLAKFKELTGSLEQLPPYVHVANSAAALWHHDCGGNVIRYGISMYGLNPSGRELELPRPLKPALSLVSELVHVKQVAKGESIGYGSTYTASEDEWIGTVPLGYADGWLRRMQGFAVLIAGQYCPIVGRVCMDQFMVKLPANLALGTKVTLIGKDGSEEITAQDVADYAHTIHYEITCCLGERLPRIYRK